MLGRAISLSVLSVAASLAATGAEEALARAERLIGSESFAEAEKVLTEGKLHHASNPELRYRLGYVLFRQRKLAPAAAEFTAVVKLVPESLPSRYFLGRIALMENQPRKAIAWLEAVVSSGQPVFDAAAHLAKAYSDIGQPRRALDALRKAIAHAPWDGPLYYRLGRAYDTLGEKTLAKEAFDTSTRLNRARRELVEQLMKCSEALRRGDRVAALSIRDDLMSAGEVDPDALVALGSTLAGAGLHNEAAPAFELAAGKAPALFQAQYNLGLNRLKRNELDAAEPPLSEAVRLLPRSPEANAALGTVFVLRGRYVDAIEPLERAYSGDPAVRQVPGLLAVAYMRGGKNEKAVTLLRDTVDQSPDEPRLWFLLVEALNALQDMEGALDAARNAQQRFPDMPQANLALGQQLARAGRYGEAGTFFQRVVEHEPANPHALLGLAESCEKNGEAARALDLYRRAIPTAGIIAELGAARSLVSLRQLPEAREALEQVVAREPGNQQVRIELARVYARLGMKEQAAEQNRVLQDLRRSQP